MKRMNPDISVCESEETDVAFLQVMGKRYPYDCVELHEYARPADFAAPLLRYEEGLMASPVERGAQTRPFAERNPSLLGQERPGADNRVRPAGGAGADH